MSARPRVLRHYEVGEEIGAGGMGRVCVGTDVRDGSPVAIKFLRASLASGDPSFRERFEREAHVAALLRSPYTVHLLDYGLSDGSPCIVMEFVEGRSAGAMLRRGPLPARQAARIARDAARALEEARARGVVHRDIKPDNILVTPSGLARVADFGIARQEAADGLTATGAYIGTVAYSAPEQLFGEAEHRSDLFALGATLYAMITGRAPFGPTGTHALAAGASPIVDYAGVPEPLVNVIRRCLERDPRDRYHSADELAGALERAMASLPERTEGIAATEGSTVVASDNVVGPGAIQSASTETLLSGGAAAAEALTVVPGGVAVGPFCAQSASPETLPPNGTGSASGATPTTSSATWLSRLRKRSVIATAFCLGAAAVAAMVIWIGAMGGGGGGKNVAAAAVAHRTETRPSIAGSPSPAKNSTPSVSATVEATAAAPTQIAATPGGAVPSPSTPAVVPGASPAAAANYISSGEWDYNFTVVSATDACANDPPVGKVIPYQYVYEETGRAAIGQIRDGEVTRITEIGGPVVGNVTFHWPQLDFDYAIDNGHAAMTQEFVDPNTGTATLTETYADGCIVVMTDNS